MTIIDWVLLIITIVVLALALYMGYIVYRFVIQPRREPGQLVRSTVRTGDRASSEYAENVLKYVYRIGDLDRAREILSEAPIDWYSDAHDELLLAYKRSRANKIVEEKKERFLNLPNVVFHYANKEQIKAFYDDYFREPTLASLVSEVTGGERGEAKASLPKLLEAKIGSQDIEKWVSTIRLPDTSVNNMFLRYQRETINSGQVALGLEEVDIELSEVNAFDKAVANLDDRFGLKIDEKLVNDQRLVLREKAAERTINKLEQATGWILVEGRFRIQDAGDLYKCVYDHPVNNYLQPGPGRILISFMIQKSQLEPGYAGYYAQTVGRSIPLKVYGQVWEQVDRGSGVLELTLTPLAVYS